jgi:hypothetical protein
MKALAVIPGTTRVHLVDRSELSQSTLDEGG